MKTFLISFMALSGIVMIGCTKSNKDQVHTPLSPSDSLFAIKASQANVAEIDAGKVSLTNAGRAGSGSRSGACSSRKRDE
jgi:hypothetical protein